MQVVRFLPFRLSMRMRERCILTEEILYDIGAIGSSCPMTFTEDENDGKHEDL